MQILCDYDIIGDMVVVKIGVPWALSRDLKIQANLTDGVVISAEDVAVASKTSFAQLLGCRGDTEPLSYGVVANAVETPNSSRPP
ncbi:unnamed protein product [Heligmosomoides polygyrus]|uniref:PHB domain-containing protein n=1 Tax=Heligmosomoides polygyrus TaxID=6339 RepID=A0A183G6V5_HELPZ|nr:unnamed protein product [Heligmosomoides polygyrus]